MPATSALMSPATLRVDNPFPGSAKIPRKVQWDLLQSYLKTLSSRSPSTTVPSWLDNIDTSALLTLLAKKRSELDILRSEAKQLSLPLPQSSGIQVLAYNMEPRSPLHTTLLPARKVANSSPTTSTIAIGFRSPATRRVRKSDDGAGHNLTKLNTTHHRPRGYTTDGGPSLSHPLSPLSPTFGPRRGLVPSGTVERRRASVPVNAFECGDAATASAGKEHKQRGAWPGSAARTKPVEPFLVGVAVGNGIGEKRVLWEAAWTEIERDLDAWVDRFAQGKRGERRGREEIWEELIVLVDERGYCT